MSNIGKLDEILENIDKILSSFLFLAINHRAFVNNKVYYG
jgi:hypothetical protein